MAFSDLVCPNNRLGSHLARTAETEYQNDDRISTCRNCGVEIRSFWIDGDEDRSGRWSKWKSKPFEIPEFP